ncbi:MAG: SH3 domain-containing protein [Desulfotalea sp.]
MRKQITKSSKLSLFILACFILSFNIVQAAEYLSINKDGINIRKGPGTNKEIAMELFADWPVKVVQKKGDWYEIVDYEGDGGWVFSKLVRKNNTVVVNVNKVANLRSGPSKNDPTIAELERGVVLHRLQRKGDWTEVKHHTGTKGWIYSSLLWPKN